jgi:peptide/nickel transport system substrate-binding protein
MDCITNGEEDSYLNLADRGNTLDYWLSRIDLSRLEGGAVMSKSRRTIDEVTASVSEELMSKGISRRGFVKLTALAAGATSIGSLLAACGDDDADVPAVEPEDDDSDEPAVEPEDDEDEDEVEDEEPEEDPEDVDEDEDEDEEVDDVAEEAPSGGELVIANEQSPVSLDPAYMRDVGTSRAIQFMYDSLVATDVDTELIPELATDWEVADDGLEYVFNLQEGVTFHDGEPFNAEAAKRNFDRLLDDSLDTNYVDDFLTWVGTTDNIEAIDDHTLRIELQELYARWIHDFMMGFSGSMISPAALDAQDDNVHNNPVGSGPYQFVEYEPDSHLIMERFDDYWRGTPGLDRIRVRVIPEQSVQMAELEAGNVDLSVSVQARDVERLEGADVQIVSQPGLTATWISFNCAKGHTQELAVRQAIARTVDREAVVSELLLGFGQVSRGGAVPEWPRYHDDLPIDPYDLEEAGQILDEAGWVMGDSGYRERDGEVLRVNVLSTQLERQLSYGLMNELIQEGIESIGIQTEIQTMEWGAYLDEFRAGEFWEVSFHAQNAAYTDGVGAQIGDTFWNVNQLFKIEDEDHELYPVQQQVLELYDVLDRTIDDDERIAAWKDIQELAQEWQLLSWLVHWDAIVGHQPRVQNLQIKPSMQYTLGSVHEITVSD